MNARQIKLRATWMARFQQSVIALKPEHAGRIDWNTANWFYDQGRIADEAAEHYVAVHPATDAGATA